MPASMTSPYDTVSYPADWLIQFLQTIRSRPDVMATLRAHPEFEMVPIPKVVLGALSTFPLGGFGFPGLEVAGGRSAMPDLAAPSMVLPERIQPEQVMPSRGSRMITERTIAQNIGELTKTAKGFIGALEQGDVDAAVTFLSNRYQDRMGRYKDEVSSKLRQFVSESKARRIMLMNGRDVEAAGDNMVATVDAAIEIDEKATRITVDLHFQRDGNEWKIAAIDLH